MSFSLPTPTDVARVAVCVCTRRRPKMLRACLNSLADQLIDATIAPVIIVVENDWTATCRPIVQDAAASCRFPMLYLHERVQGIARARNAALEKALALGVGWIAFIDDDEVAEIDWLAALMAEEYRDTPVLAGGHEMVYAETLPFWAVIKPKKEAPGREGKQCKTSTCANVRLSAEIVRAGFRFDERIGYMGGEDIEFFARVRAAGFDIRETTRATVRETAHCERLTLRGQAYRAFWNEVSNIVAMASVHGRWYGLTHKAHTIPWYAVAGVGTVIVSPLFILGGVNAFKKCVLRGVKKLAKAAGRASALVGYMPSPYKKVVGS